VTTTSSIFWTSSLHILEIVCARVNEWPTPSSKLPGQPLWRKSTSIRPQKKHSVRCLLKVRFQNRCSSCSRLQRGSASRPFRPSLMPALILAIPSISALGKRDSGSSPTVATPSHQSTDHHEHSSDAQPLSAHHRPRHELGRRAIRKQQDTCTARRSALPWPCIWAHHAGVGCP
jgi:hypothetical protein